MKTILKEVEELYSGQYIDLEVYRPASIGKYYPKVFHTDNARPYMDEPEEDLEIGLYELMDEETYNQTLLANTFEYADFEDWYGDKSAKVLVVMTME